MLDLLFTGISVVATGPIPPVDQAYLFEARQLQALSLIVHIPFVCFGIAFPIMVLYAEWRYLQRGDPVFRELAKRWSKVMISLFAVGVVTGTILSFELGMLWPGFMATYASVFGLGFALEGFSFFVEAIFIAIYVYGWDRLSPRLHLLTGIPVVISGATGSFFVIAVNSWMNNPSGFTMQDGVVVEADPWTALFGNAFLWHGWIHMYFAAFVVVGFLLASVYAWGYLRGERGRYQRTALGFALAVASIAAPLQLVIGDWAAREVAHAQPVKLAAMEGLTETTAGAPIHLLGWYDGEQVRYGIKFPYMLSLLAFHNPTATVVGLNSVPVADQPPVNVVRFAFQTMVGIGTLLAMLGVFYLYIRFRRQRMPTWPWFYRGILLAGPLSVVALIAGWVTTEVGRQPWIVYQLMRTEEAVTGASGIPLGYAALAIVYAFLAVTVLWLMRRLGRIPLSSDALEND